MWIGVIVENDKKKIETIFASALNRSIQLHGYYGYKEHDKAYIAFLNKNPKVSVIFGDNIIETSNYYLIENNRKFFVLINPGQISLLPFHKMTLGMINRYTGENIKWLTYEKYMLNGEHTNTPLDYREKEETIQRRNNQYF